MFVEYELPSPVHPRSNIDPFLLRNTGEEIYCPSGEIISCWVPLDNIIQKTTPDLKGYNLGTSKANPGPNEPTLDLGLLVADFPLQNPNPDQGEEASQAAAGGGSIVRRGNVVPESAGDVIHTPGTSAPQNGVQSGSASNSVISPFSEASASADSGSYTPGLESKFSLARK